MKTVPCDFGGCASDNDYVLVLHRNGYEGKNVTIIPGQVYNGKVHTGLHKERGKYIHKLSAITKIPAEYVSDILKEKIARDIQTAYPDAFEEVPYSNVILFLDENDLSVTDNIDKAFALCKNEEDVMTVCHRLNLGYGAEFGDYTYRIYKQDKMFDITVFDGNCHGEVPFRMRTYRFYKG